MRKIESQMVEAIQGNRNWSNANTTVTFDPETGDSMVYLHGSLIATVTDDSMTIRDGGYQSRTTKSRLNALCNAFCIAGEGVFQNPTPGISVSLSAPSTGRANSRPSPSPVNSCSPEQPSTPPPAGSFFALYCLQIKQST